MANSLGIYLYSHGFDYVVMEGTSKRHSVSSSGSIMFESGIAGEAKPLGRLIADHCKAFKTNQICVTLSSVSVLNRELGLPFSDRDKVAQVIKYEIESELYHLDIEHVHHAGNSSGVVDGSAAILWANPDYAKSNGLKARARVVACANMGDCPTLMLNAPVPAARKVLQKAGLTIDDIDVWEVNEAFAVVSEKFQRDLDLDRSKVNINGGAMALGHPIGATGAMLIGTALDELERSDGQFALITMCAGGGMAPAIIIERV